MHLNSVDGYNFGDMRVYFENTKNTIVMMQPPGTLNNSAFGDRNLVINGKSFFYDVKNDLFGEISFCPDKPGIFTKSKNTQDFFRGSIYKMKTNLKEILLKKYSMVLFEIIF